MKFFKEGGWWLPDRERHLQGWMTKVNKRVDGRLAYQYHKYQACFSYIRGTQNIAIDVGAHVGLWSYYLARDFNRVFAFEPMEAHQECWRKNVIDKNAILCMNALGDENKKVKLLTRTANSSGDTGIDLTNNPNSQEADMIRLDDFKSFPAGTIDFIKVDCEGFELFVLRGGETLLKTHNPCVIVEQKPETGGASKYNIGVRDAVEYLISLGAKLRNGIQGDYILSWEGK
jgi:FkbM family methyltransferase